MEMQKYNDDELGHLYIICRWHNGLDYSLVDNMENCCPYYEKGKNDRCKHNLATNNPPNMTPRECLNNKVRFAVVKRFYDRMAAGGTLVQLPDPPKEGE